MKTTATIIAAALLVAGCQADGNRPQTGQPVVTQSYVRLSPGVASETRAWSAEEVGRQISDMTYLRNVPGQRNEVYYFAPDHIVYAWSTGKKYVETATWIVAMRKPPGDDKEALYICGAYPRIDGNGNAIVATPLTLCLDPAVLYTPAVDRVHGDAFGIRGRKQAPFSLGLERTNIATIRR